MIFEKVTAHRLKLVPSLLQLWESSVKKTHSFLSEKDIDKLRPLVALAVKNVATLLVAKEDTGEVIGFLGLEGNKIEMLFIHPNYFRKGIGKQLLSLAIEKYHAIFVDVNEDNEKARVFYEHMGFVVSSRSGKDFHGNPFPILHMKWSGEITN